MVEGGGVQSPIFLILFILVFEQNTEIVEDCKARFEERLQAKSENITKELVKLNLRVKELEDLGEMKNIQQYTYEVRYSSSLLHSL